MSALRGCRGGWLLSGQRGADQRRQHAQAIEVRISVRHQPGHLFVDVADNGVGGATLAFGSGLRGLVDRIEGLGGRRRVFSAPGRGTTVQAEVPSGAR